jgi:hypothetical protein
LTNCYGTNWTTKLGAASTLWDCSHDICVIVCP